MYELLHLAFIRIGIWMGGGHSDCRYTNKIGKLYFIPHIRLPEGKIGMLGSLT